MPPCGEAGRSTARDAARAAPRETRARARLEPRPDAPVDKGMSSAASPIASRWRAATESAIAEPAPFAAASASAARTASAPRSTTANGTSATGCALCRPSTRTRLESRIGLSGWSFIGLSSSGMSPTNRRPWNTVRLFSGNDGLTSTMPPPARARSASSTGPILPASVESKVEQILNRMWVAPRARSHCSASSDSVTACVAGIERLFSETTTASAAGRSRLSRGTPMVCTVRRPFSDSMLARSDAPV